MELEKFEKAKKLLQEREDLKKCIHFLNSKNAQTSLKPLIIYDGYPIDGNLSCVAIPQHLANEAKKVLLDLAHKRIEFITDEFEKI